ncbi:MAG: EAL domain-containing protein, partial [bacterium]|nr:EAL domain-containing protein [bacterium]
TKEPRTKEPIPPSLYRQLFTHAAESMVVTDSHGTILAANQAFCALNGYRADEVQGRNISILHSARHGKQFYEHIWHNLHSGGCWQGNIRYKRKDGSEYPAWLSINSVRSPGSSATYYFVSIRETTELRRRERQIAFLAYYDLLTRLPNRSSLHRDLPRAIAANRASGCMLGVFSLDLDNFKLINDVFGHEQGDALLVQVAERLRGLVRSGDVLYRLGGDEFLYLLQNASTEAAIYLMAGRLLAALKEPFFLGERKIFINASIGVSSFPLDGEDGLKLLRNADLSMHRAKAEGRNRFVIFSQGIHAAQKHRFSTESGIRAGLQNGEFLVHYQPKVHIESGKTAALEALLRWQKDGNPVRPDLFIPVAEESSLIDDLCLFVMESVCSFLTKLKERDLAVPISVNISPHQFHNLDFVDLTEDLLKRHGTEPGLFEFEITERTAMQDAEHTLRILHELRQLGIALSIDDFGSGYSSLGYLSKMPVQTLKIDKQFIDDMEDNDGIVGAIIALCKQMQINVVAEGVEQASQLTRLAQMGCNEVQGYLFCRPEPEEVIVEYLQARGVYRPG